MWTNSWGQSSEQSVGSTIEAIVGATFRINRLSNRWSYAVGSAVFIYCCRDGTLMNSSGATRMDHTWSHLRGSFFGAACLDQLLEQLAWVSNWSRKRFAWISQRSNLCGSTLGAIVCMNLKASVRSSRPGTQKDSVRGGSSVERHP